MEVAPLCVSVTVDIKSVRLNKLGMIDVVSAYYVMVHENMRSDYVYENTNPYDKCVQFGS